MELLNYPITDVAFIVVTFCTMLYTGYSALEWVNSKLHLVETKKSALDSRLDRFDEKLDSISNRIERNEDDTQALKEASISRIKGKIVDRHKEYMLKGSIDFRTLDYLQQQYKAYVKMGGNSYVHELMRDLEALTLEG